jgi:acetyl-CoA carboxylase biotin carboxyl carrier protein
MSADTKNSANINSGDSRSDKDASLFETGLSFSQIKDLMTHMNKEGVTSFQMGEGKTCLSLAREKEVVYAAASPDSHMIYSGGNNMQAAAPGAAEPEKEEAAPSGFVVTSPVVGVFYDSSSPEQEPYVTLGSYVKKGDVLCVIEAMKLMNEINSPISGRITEILVKKASRVEYGHKLFVIDPGQSGEVSHE